jgi:molecular chaperone DnaJ
MVVQTTCPTCAGTGQTLQNKCGSCVGKGTETETSRVRTAIPPGVHSQSRLRLDGLGSYGKSGFGNLHIEVDVQNSSKWTRLDNNIHSSVVLSVPEATLGCTKNIETIHGKKTVNIPSGCQPETVVRLQGLGINNVGGNHSGDHMLKVSVKIPTKLTEEQHNLFEKLKNTGA